MTVWSEVQEAIYDRWLEAWRDGDQPRTPTDFDNETGFDPPAAQWVRVMVRSRPGGPGTIGRKGNRKMDRRGVVYIDLREPPGNGVKGLSDLASLARDVFEGCRFRPHDIRFNTGDIGDEALVDRGKWWGVTVELPFDYEELK